MKINYFAFRKMQVLYPQPYVKFSLLCYY
jgi:hypothetical protein